MTKPISKFKKKRPPPLNLKALKKEVSEADIKFEDSLSSFDEEMTPKDKDDLFETNTPTSP